MRQSGAYMRQLTNHHWFKNGLLPSRRQAIIWHNTGILLSGPLGTNFSEMLIEMYTFSFKNVFENVVWKTAAILSRPQCVEVVYHGDASI